MIDHNEFFYDITTRICGDLDLGKASFRTLHYLYGLMPAEELIIALFDESRQRYRVIVRSSLTESNVVDTTVPLSAAAWDKIRAYDHRQVCTVDPSTDPVICSIIQPEGISPEGCVILPLNLESSFVGVVLILSRSGKDFQASELSLLSFVTRPFGIALANALAYLDLKEQKKAADDENRTLRTLMENSHTIIGKDGGLREVYEMLELVAPLDSPVLLLGETGTGKELIANAIHSASPRCSRSFIKLNCGAIPEHLADSELFGHEKGAFTGALQRHSGRFERANGGTLFLDEIGELPLDVQVKLLRVLQEHEFERIGGTSPIRVNVRLICATNRELSELIAQGTFRKDLFYRINVFPIMIPPLRQRREDIPLLLDYFIKQKAHDMKMSSVPIVSDHDLDLLMQYDWPGNVRELQNIVERAIIMKKGNCLNFERFLPSLVSTEEISLNSAMTHTIQKALEKTGGRISGPNGAAALLKINPSTLRSRMKKLGIGQSKGEDRS